MIICHIGSGASISAIKDGKSVDTSMGMTPLEGLMMGTRSGDMDPAICDFICQKEGLTSAEMNTVLNKKSGVQGISGLSSDFRDLESAANRGDERSQLAIDIFAYKVKKYIGGYSHVIGTIKRDYITKDFQKVIHDLFLSSEQGKAIVLRSLVEEIKSNEEKSVKLYSIFIAKDSRLKELMTEAPILLSSEEDLAILRTIYKAQFTNALQDYNADDFIESIGLLGFDECKNEIWAFVNDKMSSEKTKCVKFLDSLTQETIEEYFSSDDYHPNAEVRQYLARKTQSVSWMKHPCVISKWNTSLAKNQSLSSLFKEIKSIGENVINEFSLYIAECPISSDKLKFNSKNITLVSMEDNEYLQSLKDMLQTSNKVNIKIINDYDYLKVINYALSKQCINPHSLVPIYLKKIDAEKKKNEN